jgi:hypothetical protein
MLSEINKQESSNDSQEVGEQLRTEVPLTAVAEMLKVLSQKPLTFEKLNEERREVLLAEIASFQQARDLPLDNNPPERPIGVDDTHLITIPTNYKSEKINRVQIDSSITVPSKDQISQMALGEKISFCMPIKNLSTFSVEQNPNSHMDLENDEEAIELVKGGVQPSMIGKNWKAIWGKEKTSRDILQNFFDGHNGTLEGVKIEIQRDLTSGAYKVLITGMAKYDYQKAYLLGGTSKAEDPTKAGNFGEGLKVLALNLLRDFGADYVQMASDNWRMTYTMPAKQIGEPKMFRHLESVPLQNPGNYLEFTTNSIDLLEQIFKSLNYFYHPYNPDFCGNLYTTEDGGIAIYDNRSQNGNIYLARQRFAYEKENNWEGTIPGMSIWTNEKSIDKGRDRTAVTKSELIKIQKKILNGLGDEDLVCLLKFIEPQWKDTTSATGEIIGQILDILLKRRISIPFDNKYYAGDSYRLTHDVSCVLRDTGHIFLPLSFHYIGATYIEEWHKYFANFKMIEPTASEKFRIQILHKLMSDFANELGKESHLFNWQDLLKPIYIYDQGQQRGPDKLVQGRARFDAIWLGNNLLASELHNTFNIYAHELMHKYGDDGSGGFRLAYTRYIPQILQMLATTSFGKLFKEAEILWNQSLNKNNNQSLTVKEEQDLFSGEYYQQTTLVKDRLGLYFVYVNKDVSYMTKETKGVATSFLDRHSFFEDSEDRYYTKSYLRSDSFDAPEKVKKLLSSRELAKLPAKYKPNYRIIPRIKPTYTLLTKSRIINLQDGQTHLVNISPVKRENVNPKTPKVNPYMDLSPGSSAKAMVKGGLQPSEIAATYQANWSIQKVCRDILQNFFDGHGQTLEGVKIEILALQKSENSAKTYKVKIHGLAQYDFEKAYILGASDKQDDQSNAGGFGEGLKIIALNLLRDYGVEYVKAASANWSMTYVLPKTRFSYQISKLYNILEHIPESKDQPLGNYFEFATNNPELIEVLLNATNYFYHPYNPDFQEASYENQIGGFKLLGKKQGGNVYLARQRYEYEKKGAWDNQYEGMTVWSLSKSENASIDRDRTHLDRHQVNQVISNIIDEMSVNDTIYMLRSLKEFWGEKTNNSSKTQIVRNLLSRLLYNYKVKIDFPNKYIANNLLAISREINCSISDAQKILAEDNYILCESDFGKIGMTLASDVLKEISPLSFKEAEQSIAKQIKINPANLKQISEILSPKISQAQQVRFHLLENSFRLIANNIPELNIKELTLLLSDRNNCDTKHNFLDGSKNTKLEIKPEILDLPNLETAIYALIEARLLENDVGKINTATYTYELTDFSIALTRAFMSSENLQASYLEMKILWQLSQNEDFLALIQVCESQQTLCEAKLLQEVKN